MITVVHCPVCLESWMYGVEDFDTMQEYYDWIKDFDRTLYDHIDAHRGSM